MPQALHAVTVTAEVTVLVPRGTDGTLTTAARDALAAIDRVRTVHDVEHAGFRPRATDIEVDVVAQLTVDEASGREAVATALRDGFGVRAVSVTAIEAGR